MTKLAKTIVETKQFRATIVAAILLAGILAGLETSTEIMAEHGSLLRTLDAVVLILFITEISLKLASHGRHPLNYFRDGWNVFDFVIIALCLYPSTGSFSAVLRLVRVLRLLRLVSTLPKLQLLVGALLKSLSAMGYVSLLLSLLFYIYAVAGVHLFGEVDEDFGNIGIALLTLFRIVTLDNWGDIFNRAAEHAPIIKVSIYFITFIVFGTMIILNLFIGIILNSMSATHAEIEQHNRSGRTPSLDDQLGDIERQLQSLQDTVQHLRRQGGQAKDGD